VWRRDQLHQARRRCSSAASPRRWKRSSRRSENLIVTGSIDPDEVLLWDTSFEENNFTHAELVAAARYIGSHPPGRRLKVKLRLTARELAAEHKRRVVAAKPGAAPGLAEVLLELVRDPKHGPLNLTKTELNNRLLGVVVEEIRLGKSARVEQRRPIVRFVAERIANSLINAGWR
jgi:hypothetical protein